MKLQEVFRTIQGEGLFTGCITTFIRFAGCSLRCSNCDTKYAQEFVGDDVGVPFIIDRALEIDSSPRHICITGGEPLEQPQVEIFNLLQTLQGWHGTRRLQSIVIETNGSQDVTWLLDKPFRSITHLSVDFKLPSTGKHKAMLPDNFTRLEPRDVIKFVCKDEADVKYAESFLDSLAEFDECQAIALFHAEGGQPAEWLAELVMNLDGDIYEQFDVRMGVQLHKLFNVK